MSLQLIDKLISFVDDESKSLDTDLVVDKGESVELSSNKQYEFNNILIKENGTLTSKDGGKLFIKCNTNLILENNASINLNFKGFSSDDGLGKGTDGAGGSYCTKGGDGWNTGNSGDIYDDKLEMGSGGGSWGDFEGGNGGGYIDIDLGKNGKLILNENSIISANGGDGKDTEYVYASGAGSGGCIYLKCDSTKSIVINHKTSLICAIGGKGGKGRCYQGGDGGNGKIQIILNQTGKFDEESLKHITPTPIIN